MIHLRLDDLRRPAGEVLEACLHVQGLIPDLDSLITFTFTWAAEKRQAAFLSVVHAVLLDDFGIEHDRVGRSSSALVKKGDDALTHADHIRCHADTGLLMRHQRVKQVLCDLQIIFGCDLRLPCQEYRIMHQFFNQIFIP